MRRASNRLYAIGAVFIVAVFLTSFVRGEEPAQAPTPVTETVNVQVDMIDGGQIQGTIPSHFRINTDYGSVVLDLSKVLTIDFSEEEGHTIAIVELNNKQHLHGQIVDATMKLTEKNGTIREMDFKQIREFRLIRPPVDLSLLAALAGLVTLAIMEIVLGIDNVIFLAIVVGRLPKAQQPLARRLGLGAALGTRLLLLFSLSFLLGLTKPIFSLPISGMNPDARDISWRDLILLIGGGFLIVKSVMEMHHKLEESRNQALPSESRKPQKAVSFAKIIVQIAIIDIIFSLDSVITAVGMVDTLWVMIAAMVIAMLVMLWFSGPIANFVDQYPTIKVLALSFLILIGVLLVAEGLGQHIDKGYVYFAMAFAVGVELFNIVLQPRGVPALVADGNRSEGKPLI